MAGLWCCKATTVSLLISHHFQVHVKVFQVLCDLPRLMFIQDDHWSQYNRIKQWDCAYNPFFIITAQRSITEIITALVSVSSLPLEIIFLIRIEDSWVLYLYLFCFSSLILNIWPKTLNVAPGYKKKTKNACSCENVICLRMCWNASVLACGLNCKMVGKERVYLRAFSKIDR